MKTPHALWFAAFGRIAVSAIAITAVPPLARAHRPYLVLRAGLPPDPADPDKPADVKGVPDVAPSDVATAIKYCRVAAGSSRRALYQLGRAHGAHKQMVEAIRGRAKAAGDG